MARRKWNSGILNFSKSEARGFIVLILLLASLFVARHHQRTSVGSFELLVTDHPGKEEDSQINQVQREFVNYTTKGQGTTAPISDKPVDPNTVGYDDLKAAGLSHRAIQNLLKYRESGGQFRSLQDLNRIYGIDSLSLQKIARNFMFPVTRISEPAAKGHFPTRNKIDLNRAKLEELEQVPGIGKVLASRIVRFRDLLGGFYSENQLYEVYGLTDTVLNLLVHSVAIDTHAIRKMRLNSASLEKLQNHPYINPYEAKSILSYRTLKGKFSEYKQLIDNNLISSEKYEKIKPYLELTGD